MLPLLVSLIPQYSFSLPPDKVAGVSKQIIGLWDLQQRSQIWRLFAVWGSSSSEALVRGNWCFFGVGSPQHLCISLV